MSITAIFNFLIAYGYFIAVPALILEGPVTTVTMGFLASFGLFNVWVVYGLAVVSDLVSDIAYYLIGYYAKGPLTGRFGRYIRWDQRAEEALEEQFSRRGRLLVFLAKILPGPALPTFIAAGAVRMRLLTFLQAAIPGGFIWSGGLLILGYYFGKHATSIGQILSRSGIIIAILFIGWILYQFYFGKKLSTRFIYGKSNIPRATSSSAGQVSRTAPPKILAE